MVSVRSGSADWECKAKEERKTNRRKMYFIKNVLLKVGIFFRSSDEGIPAFAGMTAIILAGRRMLRILLPAYSNWSFL